MLLTIDIGPLVAPVGQFRAHAVVAAVVEAVQVDLVVPVDPVAVRGSGDVKMLDGIIGIIDPVPARFWGCIIDPEICDIGRVLLIPEKVVIPPPQCALTISLREVDGS